MTLPEAHYAFKVNMDRVDKAASLDFNVAEIDWILNEAQLMLIKQRLKEYESTTKRSNDLSTLHVKYPVQPFITPTDLDGVYEVDLDSLVYKYFYLLRANAEIEKNNCKYSTTLKFTQSDDLSEVLKDPFNKPALDYVPYNFGLSSSGEGSSIFIYPGDYSVNKVLIEYIKYPKRINFGNYTYIDGSVSPQQGFELPDSVHDEIINIACQNTALIIQDPNFIQLRERKIQIHE